MPINRPYITDLFDQYFRTVSGVRRMVERPDEILLYRNTLEACSADEYIPVLCDIIHGHLHWRISGYSSTRSNIAAAAVSTVDGVKRAVHKGGELLTAGLQSTLSVCSRLSSGQSRPHSLSRSFIEMESDLLDFPPSPVSQVSSDCFRSAALPPPPRLSGQSSPTHVSSPASTAISSSSRYGHSGVPTSHLSSVSSPNLLADVCLVDESEWVPFDPTTHSDPRIVLFNEIIKHIYYMDPRVFNECLMTMSLKKLLMMPDQSGVGTFVYLNLFLPNEMIQYIQERYLSRPTPRVKQSIHASSRTRPPSTPLPPS